jgi:hypothetical protein
LYADPRFLITGTIGRVTSTVARERVILGPMTRDDERAYVQRWVETGRMLDELRWRELRTLDVTTALRATDQLIDAALLVPLPSARRRWSGLVEWQDVLRARS